jgi:hypothetical protein
MNDSERHKKKKSRINVWLLVGVIILIILLFVWLTIADLWGDTDVVAMTDCVKILNA